MGMIMSEYIRGYILLVFCLFCGEVFGCGITYYISPTTPTSDFSLHTNGTVTHRRTGLMWMRCAVGQNWSGTGCVGDAATYTWQQALNTAEGTTFAEYSDWRLPNRTELTSIVELSCDLGPTVNLTVFPNSPSGNFWSSTPYVAVDFWDGSFYSMSSGNDFSIRLVRN